MAKDTTIESSGHKLGQLVGDWFQDCFVQPMLSEIATKLGLYLDHRQRNRDARPSGICWSDEDGTEVDYDFVMELNGSDDKLGVPVAFFECFWRRGARHSKDKARDDSGKLIPMRDTYPTSRFLGIVASGEFTGPAREMISSRKIDLLYIPKQKIVDSFQKFKMVMDYEDKSTEGVKALIAEQFQKELTGQRKIDVARYLRELMSPTAVGAYLDRVKGSLAALPQEIRISGERKSKAHKFETVQSAGEFLGKELLEFDFSVAQDRYCYEITYSDGFEFIRQDLTLETLRELHGQITLLDIHMRKMTTA